MRSFKKIDISPEAVFRFLRKKSSKISKGKKASRFGLKKSLVTVAFKPAASTPPTIYFYPILSDLFLSVKFVNRKKLLYKKKVDQIKS